MSVKEKCCGGVIEKNGRVLMVLQDNGVFAFPKGHVEEGETEEETAKREILEETGIETVLDLSRRVELGYHIDEGDIDKTVVLFVGEPVKNNVTDADFVPRAQEGEIAEAKWVLIDEVEEKLQFPEWKEAWKKAKEML